MTIRDEEVALQEQFQQEVEQFAPPTTWSQIQRAFSTSTDGAINGIDYRGSRPSVSSSSAGTSRPSASSASASTSRPSASSSAAVAPAKRNSGHDGSSSKNHRTPTKLKKVDSDCTHDTVDTTADDGIPSSTDRCANGFPLTGDVGMGRLTMLEQEREKQQQHEYDRARNKRDSAKAKSTSRGNPRPSPRNSPRGTPRSSPRNSPTRGSPKRGSPTRGTPRGGFLGMFVDDTASDEAVARRLEQELHDAEIAVRLAREDRAAAHERAYADFSLITPARNIAPNGMDSIVESPSRPIRQRGSPSQRRKGADESTVSYPEDCRSKTMHYGGRVLLSLLIGGITFLIYVTVFGRRTSDVLDPASWLSGYPESDPSMGSVGQHNVWKPNNKGNEARSGLKLQVLNNLVLGSDWNEHMESSIYDWGHGTPDAVALNIRSMTHDPDCRAVRRAMKVCNANYGATDWRGVNQILLQDDHIITSLAKMNDYYLEGTNKAQKQYTMCHELGHGLGLGHSDENFHNKDLGNCMDYTERPQNNMHPDTSNFETLEELYGNLNDNVRTEQRLRNGGDGRLLSTKEERLLEEEFEKYAAYLSEPIEVSSKRNAQSDGEWRLLHQTDTAEYHERELGNGYSIRTSILLS
mmetsp:Transcript_18216/g.32577  ORF Transcript_18216/g.32577 Transcript_18216/m.32577 type:complete len:635 (+) Transcript_18216:331-2235(+)